MAGRPPTLPRDSIETETVEGLELFPVSRGRRSAETLYSARTPAGTRGRDIWRPGSLEGAERAGQDYSAGARTRSKLTVTSLRTDRRSLRGREIPKSLNL